MKGVIMEEQEKKKQSWHKPSWEQDSGKSGMWWWFLLGIFAVVIGIIVYNKFHQKDEISQAKLQEKYAIADSLSAIMNIKLENISQLETQRVSMEKKYLKKRWPKKAWSDYNALKDKVLVEKKEFNKILREYQEEMNRLNWRFTKLESLPAGKIKQLPGQADFHFFPDTIELKK